MTTEDDFQAKLDANSEDWQTLLVLADWLQERGDPRADGYRALAACDKVPRCPSGAPAQWYDESQCEPIRDGAPQSDLPQDWFGHLRKYWKDSPKYLRWYTTRRDARDAAALAFAKLPPERQAELLVPRRATTGPRAQKKAPRKSRKPAARKSKGNGEK